MYSKIAFFFLFISSSFALRQLEYKGDSFNPKENRELLASANKNVRGNDLQSFMDMMENRGDHRDLQNCDSCEIFEGYTIFVGDCGLIQDKTDQWCGGFCCAKSQSECCDTNGGALAGVIIGAIAVVAIIVVASCACCSCCPFHEKLCCAKKNNGMVAQPAAAAPVSDEK